MMTVSSVCWVSILAYWTDQCIISVTQHCRHGKAANFSQDRSHGRQPTRPGCLCIERHVPGQLDHSPRLPIPKTRRRAFHVYFRFKHAPDWLFSLRSYIYRQIVVFSHDPIRFYDSLDVRSMLKSRSDRMNTTLTTDKFLS